MKNSEKNTKKLSATVYAILLFSLSSGISGQTAGNFAFSVTTTSTGGYSPKHIVAMWIENSTPSFVKTKIMYGSVSNWDHLATWTSRSGGNLVDATTGATLATHGILSLIWNGTDVSGNVVPDGTYNLWVELAWAASLTTGKSVTSYSFVKGPAPYSSNPANTANLLGMSLTWTPSAPTQIENDLQNNDIRVFPNPTSGLLNIDFKKPVIGCMIQVINETGTEVFKENYADVPAGIKSLDLSSVKPGSYFLILHLPGKDVSFGIIRLK